MSKDRVMTVQERARGLARERLTRIDALLHDHAARREVAGAVGLIAVGDAVHIATAGVQDLASAVPMRRDRIFRIASMTKPVVAAAVMLLVEEGRIALDDAVDRWLPELADRRVLRAIGSPLDDTVAATRSITLRDLMVFTFGLGAVMAKPGTYPIQAAMSERGVALGPAQIPLAPDEYMRRIGSLPLMHQPGEQWMYHTGSDILTVLIARIAQKPLPAFLRERIFAPLGMK